MQERNIDASEIKSVWIDFEAPSARKSRIGKSFYVLHQFWRSERKEEEREWQKVRKKESWNVYSIAASKNASITGFLGTMTTTKKICRQQTFLTQKLLTQLLGITSKMSENHLRQKTSNIFFSQMNIVSLPDIARRTTDYRATGGVTVVFNCNCSSFHCYPFSCLLSSVSCIVACAVLANEQK